MRYLVTGATGWFGSYIVPFLRRNAHEVFAESRDGMRPIGSFDRIIHCSRGPAFPWVGHLAPSGKMLVCSSGAVICDQDSPYAIGKKNDEEVEGVRIARCYAFMGPNSPDKYAAAQFVKMAKNGGPILVTSYGTTIRSYMYITELVDRLLTVLEEGEANTPYEIGSDRPVTLLELAYRISEAARVEVDVRDGPPAPVSVYYPRNPFGGSPRVGLNEAIFRTLHD